MQAEQEAHFRMPQPEPSELHTEVSSLFPSSLLSRLQSSVSMVHEPSYELASVQLQPLTVEARGRPRWKGPMAVRDTARERKRERERGGGKRESVGEG